MVQRCEVITLYQRQMAVNWPTANRIDVSKSLAEVRISSDVAFTPCHDGLHCWHLNHLVRSTHSFINVQLCMRCDSHFPAHRHSNLLRRKIGRYKQQQRKYRLEIWFINQFQVIIIEIWPAICATQRTQWTMKFDPITWPKSSLHKSLALSPAT